MKTKKVKQEADISAIKDRISNLENVSFAERNIVNIFDKRASTIINAPLIAEKRASKAKK